jgi:membrane-bound lytic murein transglycosylase F
MLVITLCNFYVMAQRIIAFRLLLSIFLVIFASEAHSSSLPDRLITQLSSVEEFKGDFDAIKKSGKLRIIIPANIGGGRYLPRKGSPVSQQHEVAEAFARFHQLMPELIIVDNFSDMIPALETGKGDIVVGNLTVTDSRRKKIAFSVPLDQVHEKVLVSKNDETIKVVSDLNHKRVMVSPSSTFWESLNWLKNKKYKDINLIPRPSGMLDEEELDLLALGEIDATIRDSNIVEMYSGYRDDFKVAINFSGQRDIAWGVRKEAPALLNALNQYLQLEHLSEVNKEVFKGDFDVIKERKVLRVLLRNNASSYFLYKGELLGFEYEMVRAFAKFHGLRLEVMVPPTHKELLTWLVEGKADLAIGFLEPTKKREAMGITFSDAYNHEFQHVVVHKDDNLKSIRETGDRKISVRKSSAYWETLNKLSLIGMEFNLQAAPEDMETEELIKSVGAKKLDVTLADAHILDIELAKSVPVKSVFTIGEKREQAVAIRNQNLQLVTAINEFIKKNKNSEYYNILYRKYFTSRKSIKRLAKGRIENIDLNKLSPWDKVTRKYADKYGFDWRLITAQMYQESRFNPKAKSFAGAKGLMQLMPRTAKSVGVTNIEHPDSNIKGGIKYMDWLRDRFDKKIPISEKIWFTLAAYNAGHGHVQDAQRLAVQKGWDNKRWFDHTEKAMLLLSKKMYSSKARYGYVDGAEPVQYVRKIRERFEAYVKLKQNEVIQPVSLDLENPVISLNKFHDLDAQTEVNKLAYRH